jgi:hypothetical protein
VVTQDEQRRSNVEFRNDTKAMFEMPRFEIKAGFKLQRAEIKNNADALRADHNQLKWGCMSYSSARCWRSPG